MLIPGWLRAGSWRMMERTPGFDPFDLSQSKVTDLSQFLSGAESLDCMFRLSALPVLSLSVVVSVLDRRQKPWGLRERACPPGDSGIFLGTRPSWR